MEARADPNSPTLRAWLRRWRYRRYVMGRCFEASREGVALFPELRPIIGATARKPSARVTDFLGGLHCWLVQPDGTIVDATAHQYGPPAEGLQYWPFLEQPADPLEALPRRYYCDGYLPAHPNIVAAWLLRECGWSPSDPPGDQPTTQAP